MNFFKLGLLLGLFVTSGAVRAAEYYVDNVNGNDANPGSKERPFQTFKHSLEVLKGGDTLNLVPNEQPYTEQFGKLTRKHAGTREQPTVVDGHGAKLTRMTRFTADMWKDEGKGVFSVHFPNNVICMSGQGYYDGFPFVFADGQPLPPVKSFDDLVPNSSFLVLKWHRTIGLHDPLHKMLYIRLPEGKTPENTVIEAPQPSNLAAESDFMTIKNIVAEWSSSDNFDSAHGEGIVFENVDSSYCMNQAMSAHSNKETQVRFSRFAKAIDGGVLDVVFKDEHVCNVSYFGCVFEDNIKSGGAGFRGGKASKGSEFVLDSCIFRNNENNAVSASTFAKVTIRNCVIMKGDLPAKVAVTASDSAEIVLENCTIVGFPIVFSAHGEARIKAVNCKLIDCGEEAAGDVAAIEIVPGGMAGSSLNPTATVQELRKILE
jgi:hypothetical protein